MARLLNTTSRYKQLLFVATFLLLTICTEAQSHYYFKHYQVEDGLSNSKVICIVQDKKGFMWFGTIDGLNRFDGYSFKTFRNDISIPGSLGNNFINCLYCDEQNILWVGTNKGIYKYDPVHEDFKLVRFSKDHSVKAIREDLNGNIWYISNFILYKYNLKTNQIDSYTSGNYKFTSVCVTVDGNVWASTARGLIRRYNKALDCFCSDAVDSSRKSSINNWYIENIYDTKKGSLLVATLTNGIWLFDTVTRTSKAIIIRNKDGTEMYVKNFVQSGTDEYWAATDDGVYVFNISTGVCTELRMEYDNPFSLSDNSTNCLYKDKEGGIWLGSRFGGVSYYPFPYTFFTKYFPRPSTNSINGNGIHEICPDAFGNLWIGTEDAGLNKLNLKTGNIKHFKPNGKKTAISFYNIHGLLAQGKYLWIGTYLHGIDKMSITTEKVIKHYTIRNKPFASNFIIHLYLTRSAELFAGAPEGLYKYDKVSDEFLPVPGFNFETQSILEDKNGVLWICTVGNGVYRWDERKNVIENFRNNPKETNSLCNNIVNGEFLDSKGFFWFATEQGLCKYDPRQRKFKTYTINNGLPSNFLFKILQDKKGDLWISSTKGLIRFDPATEKIRTFTVADGLLNDQFNWNSAYKDRNGRMYFGSIKGLISFVPEEFKTNKIAPSVYLTNLQIYNKDVPIGIKNSVLQQSITYTKRITLKHDQSSISIDFSALSYTSPGRNEYAYKMDRLEKAWTYLKTNRRVYFTELPPGEYNFQLKASNSSGVWSKTATVLTIEISPPLWATKAAYFMYAIIFIGIVMFVVFHYRNRFLEKNKMRMEQLQHEKEKELYQNQIEFFTNVAHEIRTPLTLIQAPMEDIMEHVELVPQIRTNLEIMERNTNRLLDLTNQLLDFRQVEVKSFSLNFEQVNIAQLLYSTHANFRPLADHLHIDYRISSPVDDFYICADLDSVQKILNNLYSNAIKYAIGIVQTSFRPMVERNRIEVEIQNDGYCILPEMKDKIFEPFFRIKEAETQPGSGIGLALALTLTQKHNGTLELKESQNNRNVFVLQLPIRNEDV
ncbi:MAG: two-component regulator propeller domain-containing protein [Mucilaginibacter sp.]